MTHFDYFPTIFYAEQDLWKNKKNSDTLPLKKLSEEISAALGPAQAIVFVLSYFHYPASHISLFRKTVFLGLYLHLYLKEAFRRDYCSIKGSSGSSAAAAGELINNWCNIRFIIPTATKLRIRSQTLNKKSTTFLFFFERFQHLLWPKSRVWEHFEEEDGRCMGDGCLTKYPQ